MNGLQELIEVLDIAINNFGPCTHKDCHCHAKKAVLLGVKKTADRILKRHAKEAK